MASFAPQRPLVSLPFLLPSLSESASLVIRRNQSSYRRTVKRLRVKPDPSFASTPGQVHDHIIFNPPSSVTSVYHTPTKFLPANDIRRRLNSPTTSTNSADQSLPPPVREPYEKQYHLTEKDVLEIRKLRREDPTTWSREKLAKKFNCSNLFIGLVCAAPKEKREQQQKVLEAVQSRWGPKRRTAREDRAIRREAWGRD